MELKSGENQNIPRLIIANGNNFTAYKITLRNAPFYHLQWSGDGLTVWAMKLQSVWNVPNTDGINMSLPLERVAHRRTGFWTFVWLRLNHRGQAARAS